MGPDLCSTVLGSRVHMQVLKSDLFVVSRFLLDPSLKLMHKLAIGMKLQDRTLCKQMKGKYILDKHKTEDNGNHKKEWEIL